MSPAKPRLPLYAALLLALAAASAAVAQRDWTRASTEPIDLPAGSRITFSSMTSEAIRGEAAYSIFFPPSYGESDQRFPVVYFLHGLFNDHTSWTMDHHGDIPARIDALMAAGDVPEMVLVHPDGGRSFYTNHRDGSLRYEDYIVEELPAHVESRYRVVASPRARGLSGTSMGGYGALKIAMRHPDRFAAVAAHSPIVFPVDNPLAVPPSARRGRQFQYLSQVFRTIYGDPFDQAYFDENNPVALASRPGLDELAIYFDYGTADRYDADVGLGAGLAKLDAALTSRGVAHTFRVHEDEPHGWELVYAHIEESLSFLGRHLAADP